MATTASDRKIEIGRVISRGVDAVRRNLLPFAGLALLCGGLWAAFSLHALPRLVDGTPLSGSEWAYWVPAVIADFAAGNFLAAVLVRSTILHLNGARPDVAGSAVAALGLVVPLLGLSLLATLIVTVGLVLLIVPGIVFYLALTVAAPVLIVERPGIVASLRRSAELTSGSRGRIFLLVLIELALTWGLTTLLGLPLGDPDAMPYDAGLAVELTVTALTLGASTLVSSVLIASLYVELRTVKEGASVERLAAVFE